GAGGLQRRGECGSEFRLPCSQIPGDAKLRAQHIRSLRCQQESSRKTGAQLLSCRSERRDLLKRASLKQLLKHRMISFIVPAYNEEALIGRTLAALARAAGSVAGAY